MDKYKILKTEIESLRTWLIAKKEERFLTYIKYDKKADELFTENRKASDGWQLKADKALAKSKDYEERAEELYVALEKSGAYRREEMKMCEDNGAIIEGLAQEIIEKLSLLILQNPNLSQSDSKIAVEKLLIKAFESLPEPDFKGGENDE